MRVAFLGSLLVATAVSAANIAVQVGPNNGVTYSPNNVNASVGDVITFTFETKNHTVTQSSFTQPCVNANGIDSGFKPVTGGATLPTFQFTVNTTSPLWFYCAYPGHCKVGMVFAVNPTATNTFAKFLSNAENGGTSSSSSSSGSSGSTTGSSGSGTTASGSAAGSSNTASASTPSSTGNAAVMIGSNFGGLLTVVGLIAGLSL